MALSTTLINNSVASSLDIVFDRDRVDLFNCQGKAFCVYKLIGADCSSIQHPKISGIQDAIENGRLVIVEKLENVVSSIGVKRIISERKYLQTRFLDTVSSRFLSEAAGVPEGVITADNFKTYGTVLADAIKISESGFSKRHGMIVVTLVGIYNFGKYSYIITTPELRDSLQKTVNVFRYKCKGRGLEAGDDVDLSR